MEMLTSLYTWQSESEPSKPHVIRAAHLFKYPDFSIVLPRAHLAAATTRQMHMHTSIMKSQRDREPVRARLAFRPPRAHRGGSGEAGWGQERIHRVRDELGKLSLVSATGKTPRCWATAHPYNRPPWYLDRRHNWSHPAHLFAHSKAETMEARSPRRDTGTKVHRGSWHPSVGPGPRLTRRRDWAREQVLWCGCLEPSAVEDG